ncbi:hypothetical protein [Paenibacillus lautus]|uniref:hypothetical protein n=1 Tax=Paenibacillus TaxID=44249 RepID=UPI002DB99F28|nr:hypothetical protein [Paenibacillus lautus]MEC0207204.1 hypothetical protein [Paenibacillus lautus]
MNKKIRIILVSVIALSSIAFFILTAKGLSSDKTVLPTAQQNGNPINSSGVTQQSVNPNNSSVVKAVNPNQPSVSAKDVYPVNEYGLTYGTDIYDLYGVEPDLIAATGTDGTEGYIYASELESHVSNPREAAEYRKNNPGSWTVPLYDKTGKNIIGEFVIGGE